MKANRILSILLTGSMLLSLLPVSALAAAPVFDAPAQTTAKKAVPLVQEADASRSTEEEAATRSSRDLDAENGTAESITTIQLNADGTPTELGDDDHWGYDPSSGGRLNLNEGVFTLRPSSESGAESALQGVELIINQDADFADGTVGCWANNAGIISGGTFQWDVSNTGTISSGTFQGMVHNSGTISDGTFQGNVGNWATISGGTFQRELLNYGTISDGIFQETVANNGTISDGIFQQPVDNYKTISGGTFQQPVYNYANISGGTFKEGVAVRATSGTDATIEGGTFEKIMVLQNSDDAITIKDGLFGDAVVAGLCDSLVSITGGLFTNAVDVCSIPDPNNLSITGGYFVTKPTLPQGSDTSFATVSDQDGRTFQVPVNGGWSENGYETLYVPSGSLAQPNTITVKTAAPLTDCLAGDASIMDNVRTNADGSYAIDVHSPASIVLVTEEPTPGEPGGELDPGLSSGAAALSIVLGTAGLGYITYVCGSSLYLHYVLPDGFIPSTRQELATVLWTTAGKPGPVSTALYTDIPADAIEQQKAARWCAEQGLLSDHGETFGPDMKVYNARIIRAWNSLKKLPVPIK